MPIIEATNVKKSYGKGSAATPVLKGVSLNVEQGEFLALVGQSGSGKSTLLNIIGGLDQLDSGTVKVFNLDYAKASEREMATLRNQEIGFIFQSFNLLDHLTCLQNVLLPANFGKLDNPHKLAMQAIERVGLGEFAFRYPGELSGGQKQRIAIARALFAKPKLLLCDEPTGNLDSKTGKDVIDFFKELNEKNGITMIIVTHEKRVSEVASRVIGIQDGELISESNIAAGAGPA